MLQSFISIRPRSRPRLVYSCLLSYTLQTTKHLPLALAIIQRTIRSGCLPVPQTYLFLSKAWLNRRKECESVSSILLEMQSVGYSPDTGTCNYLISSLCKVDHVDEAVRVLKGMIVAGCIPDLDSYGTLICEMCELRMTDGVCVMIKEMVGKFGLNPRQGMVVKMLDTLQANKEIWRAVEVIEFLESQNVYLGFEGYEVVLEGCLESRQFILAAKTAMKMTDRGFIPYIKVRQKMVEGLANIGELELACAVRRMQQFILAYELCQYRYVIVIYQVPENDSLILYYWVACPHSYATDTTLLTRLSLHLDVTLISPLSAP
ncbi:hypothetical protein Leryth_005994 [Lithospermum erythrorhizon]|nr:hypothetical protein Leryth_005994 [Lithospermum erythrorhizon]